MGYEQDAEGYWEWVDAPVDRAALERLAKALHPSAPRPLASPKPMVSRETRWSDRWRNRLRWLNRRAREVLYVARYGMTEGDDW